MCPKPITGYRQDYNTLWRGKLVIGHDPDRSARCRRWVIRAVLTQCHPFPIYPDQRTSSDRPGMSQTCQFRTNALQGQLFDHLIGVTAEADGGFV
jgi:hypothetical protein